MAQQASDSVTEQHLPNAQLAGKRIPFSWLSHFQKHKAHLCEVLPLAVTFPFGKKKGNLAKNNLEFLTFFVALNKF